MDHTTLTNLREALAYHRAVSERLTKQSSEPDLSIMERRGHQAGAAMHRRFAIGIANALRRTRKAAPVPA